MVCLAENKFNLKKVKIMKNLQKYNVECIENIQIINGGCFAWDAGWAIRSLFSSIGPGALNGIPRAI